MSEYVTDQLDQVAIVGVTCRFPGAKNVDEFWQNLKDGVESISYFSDEELRANGIDPAQLNAPNYVKAKPVLEDIELFDAEFFNLNPREAEMLDPQHRIFLECAWEALENAGYDPETFSGRIGVYAGVDANTYLVNNLLSNPHLLASVNMTQNMLNDKDYLSTRVSYKLNLKGPSITVQTACSTSLVAVHLASESLLNSECDMALSGGISISVPKKVGYFYQEAGVVSPDGHCRAFDAGARGTVFGDGVGIVVLKRLTDALADGDHIYAVIRGSAINNDGSLKIGYTAPSVDGQATVITEALSVAGVDPEMITFIEAHGTGTELGDPIEIAALTRAFRRGTDKKKFCAIGSVKTNLGHLSTAAGSAGLIKTVLALKHKQIPPSLHFEQPNPQIDFENSPFYVNTTLHEWRTNGTPRRAGVSSFGMGGTNTHVILEEAPDVESSGESRPWHQLVLSAKTEWALEKATDNLAAHLKQHPDLSLADVAYTLHTGRRVFGYRRVTVCHDLDDAIAALETRDPKRVLTGFQEASDRPVAFVFPGVGDQYPNMALGLYQIEPTFRAHVDRCAEFLRPLLGLDLREVLFPDNGQVAESAQRESECIDASTSSFNLSDLLHREEERVDPATQRLNQPSLAYPAIFVIEYALAQLLMEWGVCPQAMIGHSIGEYVAACLAGVFSLEDALTLISQRGQMMQDLPGGAMLAVLLPEEAVQSFLGKGLSLSAINGPSACVLAGSTEAITELERSLLDQGIACRRVQTTHAFHSEMVEPALGPLADLIKTLQREPPEIPYLSNLTGTWITAEQATDPDYWARQMREPVRFADGIHELQKETDHILLEVGPGRTLATMKTASPNNNDATRQVVSLCRRSHDQQPDIAFLLRALGKLWLAGAQMDWAGFYAGERRHRVPLPTHPFERKRYWIEPGEVVSTSQAPAGRKPDVADWFYLPSWKRTLPLVPFKSGDPVRERECWLVFSDTCGVGSQIAQQLEQAGQDIVIVMPGAQFEEIDGKVYTINHRQPDDYDTLLQALVESHRVPRRILHLWSITANEGSRPSIELFEESQYLGAYSILFLAQTLARKALNHPLEILILSNGLHEVTGAEKLYPEKATILALSTIIPQEHPYITSRAIDVVIPEPGSAYKAEFVDRLVAEVTSETMDAVVAYRQKHRWVQTFEPSRLDDEVLGTEKLRKEGVYLITGGLGHIGLALAEYLAQTAQAKLVLVDSEGLPHRDEWAHWQDKAGQGKQIAKRIRQVQQLVELGAEVLVTATDVADREQMQALITSVYEQFGDLNGVIHAAGTENEALFQVMMNARAADVQSHLLAKVQGLYVLEELLREQRLDFCVLSSSLSTVLGGAGFAVYAAADFFLDAFAQRQNGTSAFPWISVNWDAWQLEEEEEETIAFGADLAHLVLSSAERGQVLRRILAASVTDRIVVSTGDLARRIEQGRQRVQKLRDQAHPQHLVLHERPALRTDYVPPQNETERRVAEIWQQALGIKEIGVCDDFFELGGNSLLAVQVIFQMRQALEVDIPMADLVRQPTVAFLANYVDTVRWVTEEPQEVRADQSDVREEMELWEEIEF